MTIKEVRGDRICHQCKGLCTGEVWRTKIGQRRIYFDNEDCLRTYLEKQIGCKISYETYEKLRNEFYEKVIVTQKGGK